MSDEGPPYTPDHIDCRCVMDSEDEAKAKLERALTSLTIICPSCCRPFLVHRSEWESKRSGTPLGCRGCGSAAPTRKWTLRNVPWLKVVA